MTGAYRTPSFPPPDNRAPLPDLDRQTCHGCGARGTIAFQRCVGLHWRAYHAGNGRVALFRPELDDPCNEDRNHIHVMCAKCAFETVQASHREMQRRTTQREQEQAHKRRRRIAKAKAVSTRALGALALVAAPSLGAGAYTTMTTDINSMGLASLVLWTSNVVAFYAGRLIDPCPPKECSDCEKGAEK